MAKIRNHNEYFRRVGVQTVYGEKQSPHGGACGIGYLLPPFPYHTVIGEQSRFTRCPTCNAALVGDYVWSWGEYVSGRWHTVTHFCENCFPRIVRDKLTAHAGDCGCRISLVGYRGEHLPAWLTLVEECGVPHA